MNKTTHTTDAKSVNKNPAKTTPESENEKLRIGIFFFRYFPLKERYGSLISRRFLLSFWRFFFLSPLDYYLNNSSEFIIGIGDINLPLLLICPVLIILAVFIPPLVIRGDKLNAISLLLCGLTAALYFQTLFLNKVHHALARNLNTNVV